MKTQFINWKQKLIKFKKCFQILISAPLLLSNLVVISCSFAPMRMDQVQQGEWGARVLIKDKKTSKSYLVNIDFISQKPDKLRMDINTPIGSEVASVVVNGTQTSYVVVHKRIYYKGPTSAKSFLPVLNLALDPKLLFNVLYDQPVQGSAWNCDNDKNDFVAECERAQDGMKITWSHRQGKQKIVSIAHRDFNVEIQFNSFDVPKLVKKEIFIINQPEGFRKIL